MSETMIDHANPGTAPEDPNESGGKSTRWWLFGGCGCLLIILLCGGAIAAFAIPALSAAQALNSAQATASESQAIKDALGEPIEFGRPIQRSQTDPQNFEFEVAVKGSQAEGKLIITLKWATYSNFEIAGLVFQTEDGEMIDVLNSDELNITIEDPDDF